MWVKVLREPVVDAFLISMGSNVVAELNDIADQTRSNFGQVVNSIKNAPLDLRNGSLPGKKQNRNGYVELGASRSLPRTSPKLTAIG